MNLLNRIEREIIAERLLERGDCIVAAVSGGPDSVAMLHVLFSLSERWGWRIIVAHVDHGFRGEESAGEAQFVSALADRFGLPCEIVHVDAPAYIKESGMNPQAAARELRYRFLYQVAAASDANRICLAHHADDQAETVLMRVLRGTGPAGLTGIPRRRTEKDMELVRPLLRIYKDEILEYCKVHNLEYCVDSSNLKRSYLRNEIRLDLLPQLQQRYNEQLPEALNRLADMMSAENDYLEAQTRSLFDQFVRKENDCAGWSRKWFCSVHVSLQRRLIKLILNYLAVEADSIDFIKLEQIREAILREEPSNLSLDIGGNVKLTREYDRILLHIYVVPPIPFAYPVQFQQGSVVVPETGVRVECVWMERNSSAAGTEISTQDRNVAWFDAEKLHFPLQVRSRVPGDRMSLYGLKGSKKVKDIFIDAKVPPSVRNHVPIIADGDGSIIWLPGVRRSSHAPVTADTQLILCMKLQLPGK
ncbi:tRNA lysidine(34) synthetase TilS [Paenibacillus xerothermodurans]|uniref:tRNA(Ile)-lysidine synthase n=1 Tax=Paenibacillus xerothermodurans TaxID=1977292 RepID=A0A2W1N6E8_PAEXE|nr:tRNA lysidine(34) synthetase TilS [Paenibacillus xerothermodurans]PZE19220.1 tRNA lysidine(34) synthetase TilS [Paenibacillus xerothermodurans]